jgi:DNA-binding PadR family transcriptional regulator
LRRRGWVTSEWGVTDHKQKAKFYRLTPAGKKQLSLEESRWKLFVRTVARVLRPQE